MDGTLLPCTVANPRGLRRQAGLVGVGNLPFPSEIASRNFPASPNFAGYYATNDYNAAMFLAHELASPEAVMTPVEAQESVQLLRTLIQRLSAAKNTSAEALKKLQKMAGDIPDIGSLLFSSTSMPGTLITVGNMAAAMSKSKSVVDLLDLSPADKKKLIQWASERGKASSTSAKKAFKGKIKLIRVGGQLHFEVPVTAQAQSYRVLGQVGSQVAHIPAYGTRAALNNRAMLHANGATRGLKLMTGAPVGVALAVLPQAYVDYSSSTTIEEFYKKSVYSQPVNVAAFAGGVASGALTGIVFVAVGLGGAPLVVVLAVGWLGAFGIQSLIMHLGVDRVVGDFFVK
ncbi:hypothetical protein H7698_19530 [Pseudomonas sp. p50]|uniref:hypothetical protein n=1 Tax=Pseudomonas sp. p50(2008) TaxID=2816832 RepID=UPI00188C4D3C|nr:hypothetical protein [Pseudomonas sp. p50(2008)]MBF4558276.1 hypothetical protein [Pseudomonas sp. p50(2008)]